MKHPQFQRALRNRLVCKFLKDKLGIDLVRKIDSMVLELEMPKSRLEGFLGMFRSPVVRARRQWLKDRGKPDPWDPALYLEHNFRVPEEYIQAWELSKVEVQEQYFGRPPPLFEPGVVWPTCPFEVKAMAKESWKQPPRGDNPYPWLYNLVGSSSRG